MTRYSLPLAILLTAAFSVVTSLYALPRLSVEHVTPCKTCHINPNGGGMRTEFGNVSVAANELCLPQSKKLVSAHTKSPRVAKNLLIGFDSRYLVFDNGRIFRMQTDLFAAFTPFDNFYYQFRFWESGITENYALMYFADEKYYVKIGRFYPAFGLRNADHTAYNRQRTGFLSTQYLDGLSAGAQFGGLKVVGEVFNVDEQSIVGGHTTYNYYLHPFGLFAGASFRWSEVKVDGGVPSNRTFPHAKAVFGGVNYDRFTLLGEMDFAGRSNDSLIFYANLTTRLEYGLYLIGEYSFFDADRHYRSPEDEFVRLSMELFPLPFVELRPSYTYYTRGLMKKQDDFFVQVHFGY